MFSTLLSFCFAQHLKLAQQKQPDDLYIENGVYTIFFHKQDVIQAIQDIDKHFKSDNSSFIKGVSEGSIQQVNLLSKSQYDKPIIELFRLDLACYLILKAKMTIFNNNSQINEIIIDEAPPEAELDGVVRRHFFLKEIDSKDYFFNAYIRQEIK